MAIKSDVIGDPDSIGALRTLRTPCSPDLLIYRLSSVNKLQFQLSRIDNSKDYLKNYISIEYQQFCSNKTDLTSFREKKNQNIFSFKVLFNNDTLYILCLMIPVMFQRTKNDICWHTCRSTRLGEARHDFWHIHYHY